MAEKCYKCGTIYDGWSCPACSTKEAIESAIEESTEEQQRATEEALEEQKRMLEEQREAIESAIEESQREMECALEDAAERHKKTTAEAWRLQAEAKVGRAYELYEAGLNEETIKLCLEAISQDPGNIRAYRIASWAYYASDQYPKAKDLLKKQISLLKIGEYRDSEEQALKVLQDILRIQNKEDLGRFCAAFLDASNVFGYFPANLIDELIKHSLYVAAQMLYQNKLRWSETLIGHVYGIELNKKTLAKQDTSRLNNFLSSLSYTQRNNILEAFKNIKNSGKFSESAINLLKKEILKRYDQWKPEIEKEIIEKVKHEAEWKVKERKTPAVVGWVTGFMTWNVGAAFIGQALPKLAHLLILPIAFISIFIGIFTAWMVKVKIRSGIEAELMTSMEEKEKEFLSNTLGQRIVYDGIENFLVANAYAKQRVFKQWGITVAVVSMMVIIGGLVGKGISHRAVFGEKSLQMRTPVPASYPIAADVKSIPNLSGRWKGSYINKDARGREYQIGFEMELKQNGAQIAGITMEQGDNRILTARIDGTIEGRIIRFVKQYNESPAPWPVESIKYEGSIAEDGNSISGTWKTLVLTRGWSVSRVSKNEPSKESSSLQPAANSASKTTSDFGKTFLKSLKSMVNVETTYSPDGTSPPVRKKYFLK